MARLAALALCGLLLLTACDHGSPTKGGTDTSKGTIVAAIKLGPVPRWIDGYCHKAADDLGYAVLCPVRLPPRYDLIPCRGPAPKNELWGKYCFDYVLDTVFKGPPGYHGPFAANRRAGHLALWTIAPTSDMYEGDSSGAREAVYGRSPPVSRVTPGTGGPALRREQRT